MSSKIPECFKLADESEIKAFKLHHSGNILNALSHAVMITDSNLDIVFKNTAFDNSAFISYHDEGCLKIKLSNKLNLNKKQNIEIYDSADINGCFVRNIIKESLDTESVITGTKNLTLFNNKMYVIEIEANTIHIDNNLYTITTFKEITEYYKGKITSPIYFHDLINVSGGLAAYLDVMRRFSAGEIKSQIPDLKLMADKALDISLTQREISRAEKDSLMPEILEVTLDEIFSGIKEKIRYMELDCESLKLPEIESEIEIFTDERLLMRVLGNLCINAIEEDNHAELNISYNEEEDSLIFSIKNQSFIPLENQKELFKFGYTTKGKGRGIGLYSSRLIGINVLKGNLWFESDKENGTVFNFEIPRILEDA